MGLVANKELIGERPKLSARPIPPNPARRLAPLGVWKIHSGWKQLRNLFGLDGHAAAALGILRSRPDGIGKAVPFIPARMALKRTRFQMLQSARAIPWPLVVREKH